LKRTLVGLARLTRFDEYVYLVIITTLLGAAAAGGSFNWQLVILLLANWLAVGFAYMINDIEDAPDDALSTMQTKRNPVSSGLISPKKGRIAAFLTSLLAIGLFALLGLWPLLFGVICILLGVLYSKKSIRLKTVAFLDVVSYGLILAGLPFLSGYFTYTSRLNRTWFWPFIFVMSISIYSELYNELKDLEGDRLARLRHTAIVLGERAAGLLMFGMLILALSTGVISFFLFDITPSWVILMLTALLVLFALPTLIKIRHGEGSLTSQGFLQKPLERAAALALIFHFLLPWLSQLWGRGPF